jgi:hypothetical protein
MKHQIVRSVADLDRLEASVAASAEHTARRLCESPIQSAGLSLLAALKFAPFGCDPLDSTRPLNFVEQLNQTFTYLATIAATRWLLLHHPQNAPFVLNLGTRSGTDVSSQDGQIAAETFAATDPDSNDKLRKDLAKVAESEASIKYVFYLSPVPARRLAIPGVTVVRLEHTTLSALLLPE